MKIEFLFLIGTLTLLSEIPFLCAVLAGTIAYIWIKK